MVRRSNSKSRSLSPYHQASGRYQNKRKSISREKSIDSPYRAHHKGAFDDRISESKGDNHDGAYDRRRSTSVKSHYSSNYSSYSGSPKYDNHTSRSTYKKGRTSPDYGNYKKDNGRRSRSYTPSYSDRSDSYDSEPRGYTRGGYKNNYKGRYSPKRGRSSNNYASRRYNDSRYRRSRSRDLSDNDRDPRRYRGSKNYGRNRGRFYNNSYRDRKEYDGANKDRRNESYRNDHEEERKYHENKRRAYNEKREDKDWSSGHYIDKRAQKRDEVPLNDIKDIIWEKSPPPSPSFLRMIHVLEEEEAPSDKEISNLKGDETEGSSSVSSSTDSEEERRGRKERKKRKKMKREERREKKRLKKEKKRKRGKESDDSEEESSGSDHKKERSRKKKKRRKESSSGEGEKDAKIDKTGLRGNIKYEESSDDDGDFVGPRNNLEDIMSARMNYGGALLPGEGTAMAQYVQDNKRIPRRGEIGLKSDQIENFEELGYVMSGSRHKRMNAVRMRKENQVITAEQQRQMQIMKHEERIKRENQIVSQMKEVVRKKKESINN